ncbi:MAG TPA: ABC transporter permease [Bacteroidales bacterium]|nr:ABC transporter permease [Bacteroidales bacterium]
MNKISVIIKREYLTRVSKKSFIIMTILAPVLMAALIIVPVLIMSTQDGDFKKIAVIEDKSDMFKNVLKDRDDIDFEYIENKSLDELKASFESSGYYGVLWISPLVINTPNAVQLISKKQPPIGLLEYIEGSLEKEIERQKLKAFNIDNLDDIMKNVETKVSVQTINRDSSGAEKKTSTGISMALTYGLGFLMYMLIFIFGSLVMRGVIEEKTSRVVEVIISSVKPFQLLMGKIIGIGLVGLTQFLIWILLTLSIITAFKGTILKDKNVTEITQSIPQNVMADAKLAGTAAPAAPSELPEIAKMMESAMNQPWGLIICSFIFYFITGYFLYSSIFAAIGSAVDNETETQQFMLPVTIPIILALMVAMGTMQNPESSLAFWFSIIPLTSPIVMMARIPFGVPYWQLGLSMALMLVTFVAFVWMAAKIYRIGILMYGKKASWNEMWKWLKYNG